MMTRSYTQARAELADLLDRAADDRETIIIERRGHAPVALIAADELSSLQETAHCCARRRMPAGCWVRSDVRSAARGNSLRLLSSRRVPDSNSPVRVAVFQPEFLEDLAFWVAADRKTALRPLRIVNDILRDPFTGIGKPEPLKYLASDTWARSIAWSIWCEQTASTSCRPATIIDRFC